MHRFLGWLLPMLLGSAALAGDGLGDAGWLRQVGGAACARPFIEQQQGACDPAPVDETLPPTERAKAHLERAQTLLGLLRMPQAREALDAAVAADVRNVAALSLRGRFLLSNGAANQAEQDIDAGLLIKPRDPDLLATRALLVQGRGALLTARELAEESLRLKPHSQDALWIRAGIHSALGDPDSAEQDLSTSLSFAPNDSRALQRRAALRLARGDVDGAMRDADAMLTRDSYSVEALQLRAAAHFGRGDDAAALADLNALFGDETKRRVQLMRRPDLRQAAMQRAALLVRLGQVEQGMQALDEFLVNGGRPAVLRIQVYLRANGLPDLALDGERTQALADALKVCFANRACGRGVIRAA